MVTEVLDFAVKEDLLPRNPLHDRKIELPGTPHKRTDEEIPTFDDVKKLLTHLHGPKPPGHKKLDWAQKIALVTLAAFGGLRSGECAGLEWSHIDLAKREIKVKQSLSKYDGIKEPKSKSGIRTVPINPILHNVLKAYSAFMGHRSGPLFRTQSGTKPYPRWVQVHMNEAMRSAGLVDPSGARDWQGNPHPKFTFHPLRHFAGSAWLAQGMRIQDVSWLLGHSDIKITMSTYAHQLKGDDHARQVMNTQIVKFPGIPHSSVNTEPPLLPAIAPPAIVELSVEEPKQIADMSEPDGPLDQPVPVPEVPGLEAVPTVIIPPEAPHYVSYAVRLLQSDWEVRDVAKEIGITASRLFQVFTELGMDSPGVIRQKAREARIQYHRDHGKTLKDAARIEGVNLTTAWRIEGRLKSQGREMVPRRPGGRKRKLLPTQVIETKGENAFSAGQNAGNVRENLSCCNCSHRIMTQHYGPVESSEMSETLVPQGFSHLANDNTFPRIFPQATYDLAA